MKITYLDDELKTKLKERLQREISQDNVDELWVPYLKRIMRLDGVASSECCVGHRRFNGTMRGYISLILSQPKQAILNRQMGKLLDTYPVATIRKMYTKGMNEGEFYHLSDGICCINEICFEMYAFQTFIRDALNPLLKLLGERDE